MKMLCTSEIIMNCGVHFIMLSVATGGGRRVSSVHLHRHTSGCALKNTLETCSWDSGWVLWKSAQRVHKVQRVHEVQIPSSLMTTQNVFDIVSVFRKSIEN
jgi:hypothetical protein